MNLTGSNIQLVNGLLLLSSFGGARLVYGSFQVNSSLDSSPWHLTNTMPTVLHILPNSLWYQEPNSTWSLPRIRRGQRHPQCTQHLLVREDDLSVTEANEANGERDQSSQRRCKSEKDEMSGMG